MGCGCSATPKPTFFFLGIPCCFCDCCDDCCGTNECYTNSCEPDYCACPPSYPTRPATFIPSRVEPTLVKEKIKTIETYDY
jgi:hypothetical protein